MSESKSKVQDQMNKAQDKMKDVLGQINSNVDQTFSLLTTFNQQMGKLFTMGFDEAEIVTKSAQKIGKDFVTSSCNAADEAVKAAKSCTEGSLNLLKQ